MSLFKNLIARTKLNSKRYGIIENHRLVFFTFPLLEIQCFLSDSLIVSEFRIATSYCLWKLSFQASTTWCIFGIWLSVVKLYYIITLFNKYRLIIFPIKFLLDNWVHYSNLSGCFWILFTFQVINKFSHLSFFQRFANWRNMLRVWTQTD